MMLSLSLHMVRRSWSPYVGALVALLFGTVLLATAVFVSAAVDATGRSGGTTRDERRQLADLASLFGIMGAVSLFMALFVVGSTFGFVVAARRRQLGLLRLVGATPRQVRLMVLGESAAVAVIAVVLGCLLSMVATRACFAILSWRGVIGVDLELPAPWLSWAVAAPCGLGVALLGSWRSSKRAARVSPVAAFQEAGVERRRPSAWQLTIGATCLAVVAVTFALAQRLNPLGALVVAVLLPEVLVVGLYCFGGVIFPALAGLLGRPFAGRHVAARLARDHVRTAVRAPAALAAPILAISAIAGSLILTLSLTADWTTAQNRAQLGAPYVVDTRTDPRVTDRLERAGFPLVDPQVNVPARVGPELEQVSLEVVDPDLAARGRGLMALRGDLTSLTAGGIAVTDAWASDVGIDVGDQLRVRISGVTVRAEVAAVVPDAPDLYSAVLAGRSLAPTLPGPGVSDLVFVDPGTVDVTALLDGTRGRVLSAEQWLGEVDRRTRSANEIGLWVLLGPSGLYAGIAILNAVLMGASQRRQQLATIALLGATRGQLRRMVVWEAGLVGIAALLTGATITSAVGWLIRTATSDVPELGFTVPWLPFSAIVATCTTLVVCAALTGAWRQVGGTQ